MPRLTAAILLLLAAAAPAGDLRLAFNSPAAKTETEALPIGNGRLGAMVGGQAAVEPIVVNDNSIWASGPRDTVNPRAIKELPRVRQLLFARNNAAAEKLGMQALMGVGGVGAYQPLGVLTLGFPGVETVSEYCRDLDLATGIASVQFKAGGRTLTRRYYASAPDRVLVVEIGAGAGQTVSFTVAWSRAADAKCAGAVALEGACDAGAGMKFRGQFLVLTDGGTGKAHGETYIVEGARGATILVASATSRIEKDTPLAAACEATLKAAAAKGPEALRKAHLADHEAMFNRVGIDLGERARAEAMAMQYGRYLMMSCSRPGGLPANLQGMWNEHLRPRWHSDYHLNINLEMNYYLAEPGALPECQGPLVDFLELLAARGADTATRMYGARGWVAHHMSDGWGLTTPDGGPWGLWPMGGAWLVRQAWEHYLYTGDREFLKSRGYPLMKGAARFLLDYLVEAPPGAPGAGKLVTCPSHSPENTFHIGKGGSTITLAPTMDVGICHDLFSNTIEAIDLLGLAETDGAFRAELAAAIKRLPPLRVTGSGTLAEWIEDYREAQPIHRHASHLYPVFPGRQITPDATPDLARAARATLDRRGLGVTGWSKSDKALAWARLHDGEKAHEALQALIAQHTAANLFNLHEKGATFQIDGSFGRAAAVVEMLLQSHVVPAGQLPRDGAPAPREIHLLPALPKAWASGSVSGLRARGGFAVDIRWKDGRLVEAVLTSLQGAPCLLRCDLAASLAVTREGKGVAIKSAPHRASFDTVPNARYVITPAAP